jgi:hypothetical protein
MNTRVLKNRFPKLENVYRRLISVLQSLRLVKQRPQIVVSNFVGKINWRVLFFSILIGVVILSASIQAMSLTQTSKTLSNSGSVKAIGVGIYQYQNCTSPVSSINWGILNPGSNNNVTVYIRNEGNSVAHLTLNTANWNPSTASNYMTLTWNYAGQSLNVNQVIAVEFTLSVSSSISGITNFSFATTIIASG